MSFRSKKELEVYLSKLKTFENPSLELEQYATPSSIAATWVWDMAMKREVAGRIILDAASGPGILGIGLLLLGAKKIYFVDKDQEAMQLCIANYNAVKEEYEVGQAEFVTADIRLFDENVDVAVQNPPFGTQDRHIDKVFLEKAFSVAPIVYSMHKYSTLRFVEAIVKDFNFEITESWRFDFPVKKQFEHHTKEKINVDVGLFRMQKE